MTYKKKKITILSALATVLILSATGGMLLFRNDIQATPSANDTKMPSSLFEFTGADGWRKGPSNATSMALFNNQNPGDKAPCFTSTEYYAGTVDPSAQLHESQQALRDGGLTVSPLDIKTLTIQTSNGAKQYDLQLFDIAVPGGSENVMGGHAIGYLQLSGGYLKIYGNCNTSKELLNIFPALEAVKVAGS